MGLGTIQAFVTPPAKNHGRLAWLLKAAKAYIIIYSEEKSIRHVAMAIKFLSDNKRKTSLKK